MNKVLNGRLAGRVIESDAATLVQPYVSDDGDAVFEERYQRNSDGDWTLIEEERPTWSLTTNTLKRLVEELDREDGVQ